MSTFSARVQREENKLSREETQSGDKKETTEYPSQSQQKWN